MANTLEIQGIGPVLMEKSRRARNFSLSLEGDRTIRLAIPYWVSYKEAEQTLLKNTKWIEKYLKKMDLLEKEHARLVTNNEGLDGEKGVFKLKEKLKNLSERFGFSYNKVYVRNQKTRWGSCSPKNNINLNIKLLKLPEELIDYVIVHELVHTKIKSHKEAFWAEVTRIIPDARALDARLRKYQLMFL